MIQHIASTTGVAVRLHLLVAVSPWTVQMAVNVNAADTQKLIAALTRAVEQLEVLGDKH